MPLLVPHTFKIGSKEYLVNLPDNYDNGSASNIGSAFGITKVPASYTPDATNPPDQIEVGDGLKAGYLLRIRISYKGTTTNNKMKSARVVCPIDQAKTGLSLVVGKNFKGSEVQTAGIPRRRRLG